MELWSLSPLIFAAGFLLLYSRELVVRIAGGCLAVVGLAIATDPSDADNFFMAVILGVVGAIVFIVRRPHWLRKKDSSHDEE